MATARHVAHPHFLLATDLDPAALPHVEFAARLAERLGARTTLFHAARPRPVLVEAYAAFDASHGDDDTGAIRQRLKGMARRCRSGSVHVAVDSATDARGAILEAAERIDAALIVLPTHGRTGIPRAVLGSTAEQVLRRSTRPVLLLTDRMLRRAADAGRGPVMVATDLSPLAIAAHRPAAELAERLGLPLVLASVLPSRPLPSIGAAGLATLHGDPPARIEERCRLLRGYADDLGVKADVLARVDDDPAAAIVALASAKEASLLVLATHGRRGLARMLFGSVAEQVIRHAAVPVVCLPGTAPAAR